MGFLGFQKSLKLIFGSTAFDPLPRPLPRPRPLPLPLPPRFTKDLPCFTSTSERSNSSQSTHPLCRVAPFSRGVVFLLKSISIMAESHSGQRLLVVAMRWAPSGSKTMQLHKLQLSFHLGKLTGSKTRVPSHSGQAQTPWFLKECWHVG